MTIPQFHLQLLIVWITVTIVILLGLTAILVWAVRTRQFSNQDHARYLPLESGIPEEDEPEKSREEKKG
jgi:hypothetical protein